MSIQVYTPLITAGSALLGVLGGGLISYLTNYNLKKVDFEHKIETKILNEKKSLYSSFLTQVNVAAINSIEDKSNYMEQLTPILQSISKIEILGNEKTHSIAQEIFDLLLDMFAIEPSKKHRNLPELRKAFVSCAKEELKIS